jgi:DNA polymerase III delta subunit
MMKDSKAALKKAYFYISRNEHVLKEKLEEIKEYISRGAGSGIELKVFDTSDRQSLEDVEGFVSSPSLFSEQKAVILEHIEKAPAGFQKMAAERISRDGGAGTIFIFTAPSEKINKALMDAVRKQGVIRSIKPPSSADMLKWLDKRSKEDGIGFTEDARHLLVENVNLDINLLKNEYGKLFDYISSEEEKIIDADTVKALVTRVYSMKIFDLVDFLGERDKNKSLEALEDILNEDKKLLGLITLVHRMFKSMLYIKTESGGKGSATSYLAANINMPPYFIGKTVNKYIRFSENYTREEIISIIGMLNDYDMELRKSVIDSSKLIKTLIARITGMSIRE